MPSRTSVLTACLGTLILPLAAAAQCTLSFAPPVDYPTGSGPYAFAIADLNADGRPDIAVADIDQRAITIFLSSSPDGTFTSAGTYTLSAYTYSIGIADFNADGLPDLAVPNTDASTHHVSILLNNPAEPGSFAPSDNLSAGVNPHGIAVADFNSDSRPDLAVANYAFGGPGTVSIILASPAGGFAPAVNYPVNSGPEFVAAADFDGDGRPDVAVTNGSSGTLSVLISNPDGTLQPRTDYNVGSSPLGVAAADINRDGRPDIVVANFGSPFLSIRLNNPAAPGTFLAGPNAASSIGTYTVAAADFDGDGAPDLAVSHFFSTGISILSGHDDGTFASPVDLATPTANYSLATGDFNGDGHPDLVVADYSINNISVLLNTTQGSPPTITLQPDDQTIEGGNPVAFTVGADGHGHDVTHRWHRNGQPLFDDGRILGAGTDTIFIDPVHATDAGLYTDVVSTPCGSVTSVAATLAVDCRADFNHDGAVNSQDFFDFLTAFFTAGPGADFNRDGVTNSQDFFDFLTGFFGAC